MGSEKSPSEAWMGHLQEVIEKVSRILCGKS